MQIQLESISKFCPTANTPAHFRTLRLHFASEKCDATIYLTLEQTQELLAMLQTAVASRSNHS